MRFIDLLCGEGAEHIEVYGIDFGWAFNAVGRIAVGRNIKGLVLIVRAIKIIRRAQVVGSIYGPIVFAEYGGVADRMLDRQSFLLVAGGLEKVEQSQALAIGVAADQGRVRGDGWGPNRTCGASLLHAQIRAGEIFHDLFDCAEEKHLVLDDWPANSAPELLAMKVLQGFAV